MDSDYLSESVLEFFKALADANRLKIIGLLAQQPHTVEQLAALLGLGISTTSHHLSRLSRVGLVSARVDGHYYIYSLQIDVLHEMAQTLLKKENLPKLTDNIDLEAYDRKVLDTFLDADGRIKAFPAQLKKHQIVLKYVANAFQLERRYSEKEVNAILEKFHEDTAQLRRDLIDFRLMGREGGGGAYWRLEE